MWDDKKIINLMINKNNQISPVKCRDSFIKNQDGLEEYLLNRYEYAYQYTLGEIIKAIFYNYELENKQRPIDDEFILKEFIKDNGKINASKGHIKFLQDHKDIYDYLINRFPDYIQNFTTTCDIINAIRLKLDSCVAICPICGNKMHINQEVCSKSCCERNPKKISKILETKKKNRPDDPNNNKGISESLRKFHSDPEKHLSYLKKQNDIRRERLKQDPLFYHNAAIRGSEKAKKKDPDVFIKAGKKGGAATAAIPGALSKAGKIGGKIGGKRVHELHPEQQKETAKKSNETKRRLIKEGKLNPYESKAENRFREFLEKELNIKFDYKINDKGKIIHSFPLINLDTSVYTQPYHPYDFGSEKYKIIIEFDGEYWHSTEERKNRDKHFTYNAIKQGYNIFRISDKDSKEKIDEIIKKLRLIINNKGG